MAKIRATIVVSGKIKKRGFRTFVEEKASELGVKGTVRNMPDGRVEIVCEAEKKAVEKFIKLINIKERFIRVENIETRYSKPSGKFRGFRIIRDKPLKEIEESTEAGAIYLRTLAEDMSGLRKDSGRNFGKLNENVSGLRGDTSENFTKMNRKYGSISKKLGKFEDVMSELVITLKQDRTEMKRLTNAAVTAIKGIK